MTPHPRGCIATGTPSGIGMGYNHLRHLKAGDTAELAICSGAQKQEGIADE